MEEEKKKISVLPLHANKTMANGDGGEGSCQNL